MVKFIDKYNCILCKYNKYIREGENCINHREKDEYGYCVDKCKSLSNIYYGTIIKFFPFKQIHDFNSERTWRKEEKYNKEMDEKYGDCTLETDDIKFIWGVKSWDCLSGADACLYTMNDIDITYDKKKKEYMLGIETAYMFETHAAECEYLCDCLKAFTKYMDDNGLNKDEPFRLFMSNPCTSMVAETIEELYTNFKIFVDGFYNQDIDMDERISEWKVCSMAEKKGEN